MKILYFISILFISSLYSNSIMTDDDNLEEYLNMSIDELLEVEISGSTLTSESLKTVPASVTVFTHAQIEQMGILYLEELMNYVPGFSGRRSSDSGYTNTPTVRGKRSTTSGKEVLVLMDGQRLNADFSGGAFINHHKIPVNNIKRVEFLKGAGSAIYGSNAFLGVINIITADDFNNVGVYAGSYGAYSPYLNFSHKGDDFSLSTYVSYSSYDGEKYRGLAHSAGPRTDSRDPITNKDLHIKSKYKRLNIVLNYFETQEDEFYALGGVSELNNRNIKGGFVRLGYDTSGQNILNTKFFASYRDERSDWDFLAGPGAFLDTSLEEKEISFEIQNDIKLNNESNVLFGGEYRKPETTKAKLSFNGSPDSLFGQEDSREIYALYAQYQNNFNENLALTAGLRFDHYSDFGEAYSPRIGLVYNSLESTTLKLLYSQAFRAPARDELDSVNNPVLLGNPNLDPEIAKTIEAVWIESLKHHTFILTLFNTRTEDVISDTVVSGTGGGIRTWTNGGSDTFNGVEFEMMNEFGEHLSFRSNLSFVVEQPDEFFRYVDTTASVIANWEQSKWNANVSTFYQGSTENAYPTVNNKEKLSAYVLVNAKINYQVSSNISVYMLGKNILDKEFYTPTEDTSNPDGVIGQGRQVYAGFTYKF